MNDIEDAARLVFEEELEAYHASGPSILRDHANSLIRLNRISFAFNIAGAIIALVLCIAIIVMLPLKRIVPVFININADGSHEILRDLSELPEKKQEDVIKSVLWTAVRSCEEYYFEGIKRNYDTCSALLSGTAQIEYQKWFNTDLQNPARRLRDRGHVDVEEVQNSAEIKDQIDTCRNADWCEASLSYWRTEKTVGQAATARKLYRASLGFVLVDNLDPGERTTINPAGIKIISYHKDCDDCGN